MQISTAWNLIGEAGSFRIVGGRTVYEQVDYQDSTRGEQVKLSRLDIDAEGRLRPVQRYIDPDTLIEVLPVAEVPS